MASVQQSQHPEDETTGELDTSAGHSDCFRDVARSGWSFESDLDSGTRKITRIRRKIAHETWRPRERASDVIADDAETLTSPRGNARTSADWLPDARISIATRATLGGIECGSGRVQGVGPHWVRYVRSFGKLFCVPVPPPEIYGLFHRVARRSGRRIFWVAK